MFTPGVALLISFVFQDLLKPAFDAPFIAAVSVTAWYGGLVPGLLATLVSTLALAFYFPSPVALSLAFFAVASTLIVLLIHNHTQAQADLEESEEKFRYAADLIPFGGWTADEQGNMTQVSDSFLNTFQTSQLRCSDLGWINLLVPEQRAQVRDDWLACVKKGGSWDCEYHMAPINGQRHVILSRGVPVHDASGSIRSWVGIHLDITEREILAGQRLEHEKELARSNAELDQLAYIAAHDLQEPLRMIASYVQLIKRRYRSRLDEDADAFIDLAVEGAHRLKEMLQSVQLLSYVGKLPERRALAALGPLAETAGRAVQQRHQDVPFTLSVSELPEVRCDTFEFVQLFEHLIENAVKFRRSGEPLVIRIEAGREGRFHLIRVADNGIGIEPQYFTRIFEVFQRLHSREEYPGTGIGLAICKKIVEVHGGYIRAESTPGSGTTFLFTVP